MLTMHFGSDIRPFVLQGHLVDDFGNERVVVIPGSFVEVIMHDISHRASHVSSDTFCHCLRPLSNE